MKKAWETVLGVEKSMTKLLVVGAGVVAASVVGHEASFALQMIAQHLGALVGR